MNAQLAALASGPAGAGVAAAEGPAVLAQLVGAMAHGDLGVRSLKVCERASDRVYVCLFCVCVPVFLLFLVCCGIHKLSQRCELAITLEWLSLYGSFTHAQSIELLVLLRKHRLVLPVLPLELRDYSMEDMSLLLSAVLAAFCNQRTRQSHLWNRESLVALLLATPSATVTALVGMSEDDATSPDRLLLSSSLSSTQRLTALQGASQACEADEFHESVAGFAGKGRAKGAEFWLKLWRRLEEVSQRMRAHHNRSVAVGVY